MEPDGNTSGQGAMDRFEGLGAFREAVRGALRMAAQEGWREMILSDATFADWPLGEPAVIESLEQWASPGRRLVMLAVRYDEVARAHPRFVSWRRDWSHLMECRACRDADPLQLPSAVWSPRWMLERMDALYNRGVAGSADAQRRTALREGLDEWLGKSQAAFAVTTLGL